MTTDRGDLHRVYEKALEDNVRFEERCVERGQRESARAARRRLFMGAMHSSMPLARVARAASISRPTAYKWLGDGASQEAIDDFGLLAVIGGRGPLQVDRLAGVLRVAVSELQLCLSDLVAAGLVESDGSAGCPAGRGQITVTEAGKRRLFELILELTM
jgi:hypothetical protein